MRLRAGSREHGSHVAMVTPRTPLHLGRPSRVQRYSSSIHRAMEEDSLVTRYDDENLQRYIIDIDTYFQYFFIVYLWNNYTPP